MLLWRSELGIILAVVEAGMQWTHVRAERARVYDFVWAALRNFLIPFIQIRQ